ncbi:MAG TPA: alpha/beta hydrolase-fold protein [Bryobacteraceae bacterium]|nr:alpha/beta hydrolase-fold protein [Bryobacteraceae bacterium]
MLIRRAFLATLLTACTRAEPAVRLRARPAKVATGVLKTGVTPLDLRRERDALVYNPESAPEAAPFVLYLHGATGDEKQGIRRLSALADEFGFVLLSPASEGVTWDAIRSGYGPDVRLIDKAMSMVFSQRRIDSHKMAVCGFSDGATYALGLGLSNGDLFRDVMAFSPGFVPQGTDQNGNPRIFISHGTRDQILPIDASSRRLVTDFKRAGYSVKFEEFDGPHTVPPEIAREAITWFLK